MTRSRIEAARGTWQHAQQRGGTCEVGCASQVHHRFATFVMGWSLLPLSHSSRPSIPPGAAPFGALMGC